MIRVFLGTAALCSLLFLASTAGSATKGKGAKGPAKTPAKAPSLAGKAAPPFSAKEWVNTKEPLSLEKVKGKLVVLEYWATW
ncbi:MAG: hypothetical protein AAB215_08350 [Planctomycetota bacterium]